MIGRIIKVYDEQGTTERIIESAEEYVDMLATVFGITLPAAASLWPRIVKRHEELFDV
jgi:hypothetical protein